MDRYVIAKLDDIAAVGCPCGRSRRAFAGLENSPASVHVVEITRDARVHYHKRLTEIYVVLEGCGRMELDGQSVPVEPLTAILIRPLCRHRAVGMMKILNVVIPAFDNQDEWFDESERGESV